MATSEHDISHFSPSKAKFLESTVVIARKNAWPALWKVARTRFNIFIPLLFFFPMYFVQQICFCTFSSRSPEREVTSFFSARSRPKHLAQWVGITMNNSQQRRQRWCQWIDLFGSWKLHYAEIQERKGLNWEQSFPIQTNKQSECFTLCALNTEPNELNGPCTLSVVGFGF